MWNFSVTQKLLIQKCLTPIDSMTKSEPTVFFFFFGLSSEKSDALKKLIRKRKLEQKKRNHNSVSR